ncbi:MAG: TRAP transporter fused permease subunit [Proteobacteria bacterium]|nr:TRAP transporter fused permease subunit [Pseudomonadota bacterium]MDA1060095.1 TRAP transporter fused permease subunit [Pseudomonadota bacterium]
MIRDIAYGETSFMRHWRGWVIAVLGSFYVLIHLYAGFYGPPESILFRAFHVGTALALVFLYFPLFKNARGPLKWVAWTIDFILIAGAFWIVTYFVLELETWDYRRFALRFEEYFTAALLTLLVLEAARRAVGPVLVVICAIFLLQARFADHFPGMFYGPPASWDRLTETLLLGSDGIFGIPVAVMAQFVVLFILFGTLLNITGGGKFFTRLAFALFGHRTGGPAKAAVVSSAMMGSLSGSSIGNVMTTGTFTIPLMRHLGYKRAFAGGVEAAASNGGIIMPPVMGAVAFIMAEFLDRPYLEIIMAAAIPALLYYVVIFVTVHLEAKKLGLATMDKANLPSPWPIIWRQGYLALPLVLIIVALVLGYSIVYVAIVIIITTFALALLQRTNRMTPVRLADAIEQTARATVGLSATAAAAGIIIGSIFATGLSFQISQAAVEFSGGQIWILLLITAIMALIMGMGMTAAAVYITLVATVIPILTRAGIPDIAAHFFAFYYGIISNITPPIALTAFAAAPIAGAGPMATAVQATRLGAASFLLPILFIYGPALLLEGEWWEVITVSGTAFLGLSSLAITFTGYLFGPVPMWQRVFFLGATGLLIAPELATDLGGITLFAVGCAVNFWWSRRPETGAGTERRLVRREERANADPTTGVGGFFQRMVQRRLEKEGEEAKLDAPPKDINDLTKELMSDKEGDGNTKEVTTVGLFIGWGVVIAIAGAFEFMGQIVLHATDPLVWLAVMAALSVGGVFGIVVTWRTFARSENAPPPYKAR